MKRWSQACTAEVDSDALLAPAALMLFVQFLREPCGLELITPFANVPRTGRGSARRAQRSNLG